VGSRVSFITHEPATLHRRFGRFEDSSDGRRVAGTSLDGSVYVAITCVGRANERAVAVVLGIGQNPAFVRQVVESSADQVRTAGVAD